MCVFVCMYVCIHICDKFIHMYQCTHVYKTQQAPDKRVPEFWRLFMNTITTNKLENCLMTPPRWLIHTNMTDEHTVAVCCSVLQWDDNSYSTSTGGLPRDSSALVWLRCSVLPRLIHAAVVPQIIKMAFVCLASPVCNNISKFICFFIHKSRRTSRF